MIVLIFIAGEDTVNPLADQFEHRVLGITASIAQQGGERLGELQFLIKLAEHQQPRITGKPPR